MIFSKIKLFLPLLLILTIYFGLRLQNIVSLPVFGDEAIYLRWSQIIKNVETLRFIPLTDGKQPLYMWIVAATYKFISDPLVAGRLVSIISGSLTIISVYIFSLIFFSPKIAIISSVIYLTLPFTFFFDRMALPDNLLSTIGTLSILFAFLLAKFPRLDLSMILGVILGLGWITKSPAIYFIVLSTVTFLFYHKNNLTKIYLPLISITIAFVIYNLLRLGPQFHQIYLRNLDYVWPISEILKHPLDPLVPHLKDIFTLYFHYISIPLIITLIFSLLINFKSITQNHTIKILLLWWILPLIANATIAKVFTARYILFTIPPLILIFGYIFSQISFKKIHFYIALFAILSILNLSWIYQISTNPFAVKLPPTESGYNTSWTSGWGIKSVSNYLINRSKLVNVIVGTEGYFGTLPDGLQIYTDSLNQLTIFGVGLDINKIPDKLIDARHHQDEVYLLFNKSRLKLTPKDYDSLELIQEHFKPDQDKLVLYRLK